MSLSEALGDVLVPGQNVVIGQAFGAPQALIDALPGQLDRLRGSTLYVGMFVGEFPDLPGTTIRAFFPSGPLSDADELRRRNGTYLRRSLYEFSSAFLTGEIAVDVVLAQAAEPRDGRISLATSVDYIAAAASHARSVVLETGPCVPWTGPASTIAGEVATVRSLSLDVVPVPLVRRASDADLAMAANLDEWIPDGATLQLGMAGWVAPLAERLRARRGLRVHTGLISDWVQRLSEAGALDPEARAVGTGAGGTPDFYRWLDDGETAELFPANISHAPETLAGLRDLRAVNSVFEVDLAGRANSEYAGGRVGGVAGLRDFGAGAARNVDGLSIIALGASSRGRSRIVPQLTPERTSLGDDAVEMIVTEHGVADLRGRSPQERAAGLIAIASPEHRSELERAAREIELL